MPSAGSWRQPYGYAWNIYRNTYAIYLQDSWTIGGKLTINAGLRTESEYIPTFNPDVPAEYTKPIEFGFADKLAPRFGAVYDVFGDSSLKVFGSFGIYYDVMKLYMAEGAFGGFKWQTDYYTLDNADYRLIAANGLVSNTDPNAGASGRRRHQPGGGREVPGHHRLAHPLVRYAPAGYEARRPAGSLPRRREEAVGRPVLLGPRRLEAPAADDRGHRHRRPRG